MSGKRTKNGAAGLIHGGDDRAESTADGMQVHVPDADPCSRVNEQQACQQTSDNDAIKTWKRNREQRKPRQRKPAAGTTKKLRWPLLALRHEQIARLREGMGLRVLAASAC